VVDVHGVLLCEVSEPAVLSRSRHCSLQENPSSSQPLYIQNRQAEQGVSLEAQEVKIRAMATVQGAELFEVIVDGGESAKNLNRPACSVGRLGGPVPKSRRLSLLLSTG